MCDTKTFENNKNYTFGIMFGFLSRDIFCTKNTFCINANN